MGHIIDAGASATRDRRDQITALFAAGGLEACRDAVLAEVGSGADGRAWCTDLAVAVMAAGDLRAAGALVDLLARTAWGSARRPARHADGRAVPPPPSPPRRRLSAAKLRHDADQFDLLRRRGLLDATFDAVIADYRAVAARLAPAGGHRLVDPSPADLARIGHLYNRIVHVPDAPRVARALSRGWTPADVEGRFRAHPTGVAVIDDLLSPAALAGAIRFCQEATVWSGNEHPDGDLHASFFEGFTSPLLVQMADELRTRLPRVLGESRRLVHLTGAKAASARCDAARATAPAAPDEVTVLVWLTPTVANLDPASGGLRIADGRGTRIPYRANRAVLLAPGVRRRSEAVSFAPDYERRRVTIALQYGIRSPDGR